MTDHDAAPALKFPRVDLLQPGNRIRLLGTDRTERTVSATAPRPSGLGLVVDITCADGTVVTMFPEQHVELLGHDDYPVCPELAYAMRCATDHRTALVDTGWACDPIAVVDGEPSFEVTYTGSPLLGPHRRSFDVRGGLAVHRQAPVVDTSPVVPVGGRSRRRARR